MAGKAVFRFSFGPWNIHDGADVFGPPVRAKLDKAKKMALYKKLGFDGIQFHDDDVVASVDVPHDQMVKEATEMKKVLDGEGLIPEFVGRVPVITSVAQLDEEALVKVLTEPRNALAKQYGRLFELDNVELEITEEALLAVAEQALERGTGARGLRAILEEVLLQVMYDVPSREDIAKVVIDADTVRHKAAPTLIPKVAAAPVRRERREKTA